MQTTVARHAIPEQSVGNLPLAEAVEPILNSYCEGHFGFTLIKQTLFMYSHGSAGWTTREGQFAMMQSPVRPN